MAYVEESCLLSLLWLAWAHGQPITRCRAIPTWGYHRLLQLRDDYFAFMADRGQQGTLRDFHDRVMRIGMLPIGLIREAMFHELDTELVD